MTTNRLAKSEVKEGRLTAAEMAAICREKGLLRHAAAWDQRASELGEERIPNGISVYYREDGTKQRVGIA
jgi:hypothetical protein